MIWRVVRSLACLALSLVLAGLTYAGSQVPLPENAGTFDVVHHSLRSASALWGLHLSDGESQLASAREAIELDPTLKQLGWAGAEILAKQSTDSAERINAARLMLEHSDRQHQEEALILAIGTGDPDLIKLATSLSGPTSEQSSSVRRALVQAGTRVRDPDVLAEALNLLAADPALTGPDEARTLIDGALEGRRPELLNPVAQVASMLDEATRGELANRLVDSEVDWIGDWDRAAQLALSVERTSHVLNEVGVRSSDLRESVALFKEAHELDPADVIIGANFAVTMKTLAICYGEPYEDIAELDGLLDAGLAEHPDAWDWAWARNHSI